MVGVLDSGALLAMVALLKAKELGVKKIVVEVNAQHPEWGIGSKEVRDVLQKLDDDERAANVAAPSPRDLAACEEEEVEATPSNRVSAPAFEVVPIEGKGLGVVAARNLARGERLIAESPLARADPGRARDKAIADAAKLRNIERAVKAMAEERQKQFFSLHQHHERFGEQKTVEGVWGTNALPLDNSESAIFLEVRAAGRRVVV